MKLYIKAVIFDLDGVITDTMPFHYHAWKSVLAQEQLKVKRIDVYKREGQRGVHSLISIFNDYGIVCSPPKAKRLLLQKEKIFKRIVKQKYISGSRNFLKFLHSKKIPLALVTGTAKHEVRRILPEKIIKYFTVIITGSDVYLGKPDPEPYQKALDLLKLNPAQAVVIENAPSGIKSAKAAGIKCLALTTSLPQHFLKEADKVYHSFNTLRRQVQFINHSGAIGDQK